MSGAAGQRGTARMGRPPGSTAEATRSKIRHHGRKVFSELGFERTTLELIAESAGISRTALGRYYRSKSELYRELLDEVDASIWGELIRGGGPDGDAVGKLAWLFRRAGRFNAEDNTVARFVITSLVDGFRHPEFAPMMGAQVQKMRAAFVEAVEEGHVENRGAKAEPHLVADFLLATLWGLGLFGAFMDDARDLEEIIGFIGSHVAQAVLEA